MEEEHYHDTDLQGFDDALSLRDLHIHGSDTGSNNLSLRSSPRSSSATDLFEFFSGFSPRPNASKVIVFCGKIIHGGEEELNEYQKRDYLSVVSSASFQRTPDHRLRSDDKGSRVAAGPSRFSSSGRISSSIQKVNLTSLTSMSAKSKRRMFMFGPVKFKPEMDLSAIRERQGRLARAPPPAASDGFGSTGGKGSHWGLLRTLSCRSRLATALARSLGCISMPVVL